MTSTWENDGRTNTINRVETSDTNCAAEINGLQRGPRPTVQMPQVICLSQQLKKSDLSENTPSNGLN